MDILTGNTPALLWHDLIKEAENHCDVALQTDIEAYLIILLNRYLKQPDMMSQTVATAFMQALQSSSIGRSYALQQVGDQCLLYAGLFPKMADKRHVKLSYFVRLGQTAYSTVSAQTYDLYWSLAHHFVAMMDVLQSIQPTILTPLEAYEQWEAVGSKRALKMLGNYTQSHRSD